MSSEQGKDSRKELWRDTPVSGEEAGELLMTARTQLFMNKKFWGRLAMRLQFIKSSQIPTAAVDVRGRFYYNPKFINILKLPDAIWVVAHEIFHLVQRCHARFPEGGLHTFWNQASDIVGNQALQKCGLVPSAELQKEFLGFSPDHQQYQDKVSEFVYYDLIKNAKDKSECPACKAIANGILDEHRQRTSDANKKRQEEMDDKASGSKDEDGDGDSSEHSECDGGHDEECCEHGSHDVASGDATNGEPGQDKGSGSGSGIPEHTCGAGACCSGVTSDQSQGQECGDAEEWNKWERGVLSAAEGVDRGELPGEVQRIIDDLVKPSVTWKDLLRSQASAVFGKGRYTWKRPGRRSLATGIRLPTRQPETLGALLWMDSSLSIGSPTLTQFASEAMGILQQTGCTKILVGCHDVNAYTLVEVKNAEDLKKINFRTGGTSHVDVFDITEGKVGAEGVTLPKGYQVGMVVCLTDMMSEFPNSCSYPVIWGIPSEYFHSGDRHGYDANFGTKVEVNINV